MITTREIYRYIDSIAPFDSAMSFDNPGLLVGDYDKEVNTVLLSLDITPSVAHEARELGAQLIISHHPIIFNPLKKLSTGTAPYLLAQYGITAICAHTNLDMADGGVNTCLAKRLKLKNLSALVKNEKGMTEAFWGETEKEYSPFEFAEFVKQSLGCEGLRFTDGLRNITKVGLCSGGGADFVYEAAKIGCQAFVTGESKHNILLDAENMGITYVDAGHFYTEDVVIEPLLIKLSNKFQNVKFVKSKRMHSPAKYI